MPADRTSDTLTQAANALEAASTDRHHAVHGTRRPWRNCPKDTCDADKQLVAGLRQLAAIRDAHPGRLSDYDARAIAEGLQQV